MVTLPSLLPLLPSWVASDEPGIAKADMLEFYQELSTDPHVFSLWLANWGQRSYFVNYDKHDEDEFLCLMTTVTNTQYAACMQMSPSA